jgi:guanosine-3',5'-bis(diphosphate) 3'-pyrophosphohydrolase
VSHDVESAAGLKTGPATPADPPAAVPRAPSATRRVRTRLARRITAQRAAPVKQVLEPLAAVHRELHPKADLGLLQQA